MENDFPNVNDWLLLCVFQLLSSATGAFRHQPPSQPEPPAPLPLSGTHFAIVLGEGKACGWAYRVVRVV